MSHIDTVQSYIQNAWVSEVNTKIKWNLIEILNQPMITEYGIIQMLFSTFIHTLTRSNLIMIHFVLGSLALFKGMTFYFLVPNRENHIQVSDTLGYQVVLTNNTLEYQELQTKGLFLCLILSKKDCINPPIYDHFEHLSQKVRIVSHSKRVEIKP